MATAKAQPKQATQKKRPKGIIRNTQELFEHTSSTIGTSVEVLNTLSYTALDKTRNQYIRSHVQGAMDLHEAHREFSEENPDVYNDIMANMTLPWDSDC